MEYLEFKKAVIARADALGLADYELYYQAGESTSVGVFGHEINEFSASNDGGVCFRCIVDGKMGYAATQALNAAEAAAIVDRAADNAAVLEAEEPEFLCEGGKCYQSPNVAAYDLPTTEELIAKALDVQERLYAEDAMVVDGCETNAISETVQLAIYNSRGLDLQYENRMSGLVIQAVVQDGEEKVNDYQIKMGKLDTLDTAGLISRAVWEAKRKLGGEVAPTGAYPVVFAPDAVVSLLQVYSSIFSSEAAQKGLSRLADAEGQVIASEQVTLMDDPFYKDSPMPIGFDAEGSPTYCKAVIEKGVLNTLLYNLKTAAVAGKETTGNAAKSGYDSPIGLRPFTMYLAPGQISEEELLQKAGSGVYINSLQGLHAGASPVTGDFSLQSAGFLIENGVKTTPVKSFTVAGNFYDLLKNITAVADNLEFPTAVGMTVFGAPSVLAEGLSVAGK